MKTILNFIHSAIQVIVVVLSLLLIDLPLKVISCITIIILAIIVYLFYPITKRISCPNWIKDWISYATSIEVFLATSIGRMWS